MLFSPPGHRPGHALSRGLGTRDRARVKIAALDPPVKIVAACLATIRRPLPIDDRLFLPVHNSRQFETAPHDRIARAGRAGHLATATRPRPGQFSFARAGAPLAGPTCATIYCTTYGKWCRQMVGQSKFINNFNGSTVMARRPLRHDLIGFLRLPAPATGSAMPTVHGVPLGSLLTTCSTETGRYRRFIGDTHERGVLLSRALRASTGLCDGAIHRATLSSQRVQTQPISTERNRLRSTL